MQKIITEIEKQLGNKIQSSKSVGGGCIANAKLLTMQSDKSYFLKSLSGSPGMFYNESNGLRELAKSKSLRVPEVILAHDNFLVLEAISSGLKRNDFFEKFGQGFAKMHRFSNTDFGFFEDNYIGASPQYNVASQEEKKDWTTFYFNKRLLPQLKMAENHGFASHELIKGMAKLEKKLPTILSGSEEKPSLLHGDLWGGNYICDSNGQAVLIDPAVYYGHREADLAMTKMFGGFTNPFYEAYQKEYPLKEGWEYREKLYLLYHTLNHLNLFGTGYYQQTINLIQYYL